MSDRYELYYGNQRRPYCENYVSSYSHLSFHNDNILLLLILIWFYHNIISIKIDHNPWKWTETHCFSLCLIIIMLRQLLLLCIIYVISTQVRKHSLDSYTEYPWIKYWSYTRWVRKYEYKWKSWKKVLPWVNHKKEGICNNQCVLSQ